MSSSWGISIFGESRGFVANHGEDASDISLWAHKYKVPVIFITAHSSDEQARSEAASDWTVGFFIKPFSGDELLDAVNAALKRKQNNLGT